MLITPLKAPDVLRWMALIAMMFGIGDMVRAQPCCELAPQGHSVYCRFRSPQRTAVPACGCGEQNTGCDCAARVGSSEMTAGEPAPAAPDTDLDSVSLLDDTTGAGFGYESAAPHLIGDFFGGGVQQIQVRRTVPVTIYVRGFEATSSPGGPGSPNAVLIFESSAGSPNDFTTNGPGFDASGDNQADTFPISEPVPPNDSPVSPGPGFVFDGGTAVYTNSTALTTAQNGQFEDGDIWYASYSFSETININVPAGGGAVVRRIKLAENNSPMPRDRVFGTFNFFNDVANGFGDVSRYAPGFEKTFWDGGMSLDVRFPFAATLDSDQTAEGAGSKNAEFGNTTLVWKALLWEDASLLFSSGLGVALPTADDTRLYRRGQQLLHIENDAVHLLPFVAMLCMPNDETFVQAFAQIDVDSNGNPVRGDAFGAHLQDIGRLQDATLLFLDVTAGVWLYRNPYADVITAVAPVLELHYSSTVQDADVLTGNGFTIDAVSNRFDVLNMTVGSHFYLGDRLTITPAIAFPLRTGDDEQFDYEAIVQANWYF